MSASAASTYCVLGPLAAEIGGERVALGGRRQRMVLAMLIANVDRVVGQEALVEGVWNGETPASGPRSLHTYVSNLRRLLDGAIERDGEGYVLRVEPMTVDAVRFEESLARGRDLLADEPAEAAEVLQDGLGLWTGPAYGDLGPEAPLAVEANRLGGQRLEALELRFQADLALGRHVQIAPELEALVHDEPYREGLAAMLMLALYRSGRPAESLRVYQRVRTRLVEELGTEPGPSLQDMERRVLQQDPGLGIDPPVRTVTGRGARGYELHDLIGTSPFGERHRGFQGTLAREVNVLVIESPDLDSPDFIRRFDAEMQAVARFEHPNLAPVLDYWREPGGAYVISPHYRGGTLESALLEGPLDLGTAVRITSQLASSLDLLHRQGYPHGSVRSGSVLLDEEGNGYLTDVGLIPVVAPSPPATRAEDVEQLASLVLEMLGDDGPTNREIRHVVARARHPEPSNRFTTVLEFSRALRQSTGRDVQPVQLRSTGLHRAAEPLQGSGRLP